MSTPDTPGNRPASGEGAPANEGDRPRAKGQNPTVGDVAAAGRAADAARADQARTMRDRVGQQAPAQGGPAPADEAATKAYAAAPRPTARPVVTGTAAPGQRPAPASAPSASAPTTPAQGSAAAQTAAAVDGPTSHIARNKVQTSGMPDLSAVQHPSGATPESPRESSDSRRRPAVSVGSRRGRGPLRASMQLRSIDPWSTLKISLLLSVALFFVWLVAVGIIYLVLDGMGVWDRLNTGVTDIMSNSDGAATLIGPGQVFGVAAIIGIINVVLFTAMATIGAFIYNMSAEAVGGVEVTLADRD